ncbi:MAG: antibiotic biosynthesis monooxygenase [Pseudomonadota bacterium]
MPRVSLKGHIDVPPDRLEAVAEALPLHIELSRAEPGCIFFNVDPCPAVPGRFLVSESFVDRRSFDAHQTRTRASAWATVTAGIPREYEITEER